MTEWLARFPQQWMEKCVSDILGSPIQTSPHLLKQSDCNCHVLQTPVYGEMLMCLFHTVCVNRWMLQIYMGNSTDIRTDRKTER